MSGPKPGLKARDIGHRVVVRHRIPGGLTDVIGVLQSWDPEGLVVRHVDSSLHEIHVSDVTAAKTIPEMPLRPVDAAGVPGDADTILTDETTNLGIVVPIAAAVRSP